MKTAALCWAFKIRGGFWSEVGIFGGEVVCEVLSMGEGLCRGILMFRRGGGRFDFNGLGAGRIWEWEFGGGCLLGDCWCFVDELGFWGKLVGLCRDVLGFLMGVNFGCCIG